MGSYKSHAELEVLNLSKWTWETKTSYPYHSDIAYHANVVHESKFIVFGGYTSNGKVATVASFSKEKWKELGELRNARSSHNCITSQNRFLVVGDEKTSESCILEGNSISCTSQEPTIEQFPQLFNVHVEYCKTKE